ncbi:hypothetical protein E4U42_001870 [Claviceps africana]|uniref:Glycosyltransferase family 28 N-terminal domain-containing protein n=1 Tax=Claviceps africana TaxID=83212 RepID=A0A8K0JF09_9HYPO|nr:hypothetical protein E4U42_001870 [Claviceps africana]
MSSVDEQARPAGSGISTTPSPQPPFPGKLDIPSRPAAGTDLRKQSAPAFATDRGLLPERPLALERWQTATYADRREHAESIPSRAWIPLSGDVVGRSVTRDEHESDSSSSDELEGAAPRAGSGADSASAATLKAKRSDGTTGRDGKRSRNKKSLMHKVLMRNKHCNSTGRTSRDGRLQITVHETAHTGYIAHALGAVAHSMRREPPHRSRAKAPPPLLPTPQLHLNIVVMVVGSRGDVQPFLRIGKYLRDEFGHRVRIATHPTFRDLVEKDSGLEFFSVGGDPAELMAFMVKNPGMIPTLETVRAGEIGRRREGMAEMFDGFWRSCIHANEEERISDQEADAMDGRHVFIADVIIANPPCFAHIHCAEALGIPLQLVFTFPYTPTRAFPHPLANIKKSNVDQGYTNFISYPLVEMMTWQGLGDLINDFRVRTLSLHPISTLWAPCATYRMHVPVTYLWSPALVPKPEDWGEEVNVSGFVFLDLASSFRPLAPLLDFLDAGEPPIYIGFGSIVVDDADSFTELIFEAVQKAGVRALVSRGWGGFGRDKAPDNVFMLDNTPHDWLFPRVKACVHHGGAGTTAIGLKCGLPTMIIPFFGDQYFWGSMMGKSGAGPEPVPYKHLTSDKLAQGIKYLLTEEAKSAAAKLAESIAKEGDGAQNTVATFLKNVKLYGPSSMSCAILPSHVSVWHVKGTHVQLSAPAAHVLVTSGQLTWKDLRLRRHTEWLDFDGPGEPVTAVAESIKNTVRDVFVGVGSAPYRVSKTAKRRVKHKMKSIRKSEDVPQHGAEGGSPSDELTRQPSAVPGPGQYCRDLSVSVGKAFLAVATAPSSLFVALALGFHNAPRLYGDDTVRRPTRVSGFRSGLVAARREFVYGMYDGVTGLVRLPVRGARTEGAVGFFKGAGMGVSGLVLKPISAILGPIGFGMQGVVKQISRQHGPQTYVRRARMASGKSQVESMDAAAQQALRDEVLAGWKVLQDLGRAIADEERRRGLAGQIDRMTLDVAFLFVSVERAKTCLADLRAGDSLDNIVTGYRQWNNKAVDPSYHRHTGASRRSHEHT